MIRIGRISGKAKILSNIERVKSNTKKTIHIPLSDAANLLRDKAIENVKNWSQVPGLSKDGQSIIDKNNWYTIREGDTSIKLLCDSDHAAVVEFGGNLTGRNYIGPPNIARGFPVGKQQFGGAIIGNRYPIVGKPVIVRKVKIQRPMAYFRSARDTPSVKASMKSRIKSGILKNIRGMI